MIVYIDTCCYGRPTDKQTQFDVVAETAAIKAIIEICQIAGYAIVGSMALEFELGHIKDAEKRDKIITSYKKTTNKYYTITENNEIRAQTLQVNGIKKMDSYHLAIAETAGADILLTTDKDFIRICKNKKLSVVRVINPLTFLPEIIK